MAAELLALDSLLAESDDAAFTAVTSATEWVAESPSQQPVHSESQQELGTEQLLQQAHATAQQPEHEPILEDVLQQQAANLSTEQGASQGAAADVPEQLTGTAEEPRPPQPRNDYLEFREKLRHPSAQTVTAKLQDFVRRFPVGLSREQAASRIHKFLSVTQEWMLSEIISFSADADEEGRTNAAEGLEKFLLSRLHPRIFAADPADLEEDNRLRKQIDSLSWVTFEHLGIPPVDTSLLELCVQELQRMDNFKAPRDKMVCIVNTCYAINDVLKRAVTANGAVGRPLSADDFLPMLIFVLIVANPPGLQSNLEFTAAFRHPSRLVAEDAYFLTALQSAVAFIKDANSKALEVTEEEFNRLCEESLATKGYINGELPVSQSEEMGAMMEQPADVPRVAATASEKGLELGSAAQQLLLERLTKLPLRFEGLQSVRHLKLGDVTALLEEYREMAQLLKDVERGSLSDD